MEKLKMMIIILFKNWILSLVTMEKRMQRQRLEGCVVEVKVVISQNLGVLQGFLFEDIWIILTRDARPFGHDSEYVCLEHFRHV